MVRSRKARAGLHAHPTVPAQPAGWLSHAAAAVAITALGIAAVGVGAGPTSAAPRSAVAVAAAVQAAPQDVDDPGTGATPPALGSTAFDPAAPTPSAAPNSGTTLSAALVAERAAQRAEALAKQAAATERAARQASAQARQQQLSAREQLAAAQNAKLAKEALQRAVDARVAAELARLQAQQAVAVETGVGSVPLVVGMATGSTLGFAMPVSGAVTSPFGQRLHPILHVWKLHDGTDLRAACGTPLRAPADGVVRTARYDGAYGNRVVLDHGVIEGHSVATGYAHLTSFSVQPGQRVVRGQLLGYTGTTGRSTGCHLHLMAWVDGNVTNPMTSVFAS